MVPRRQVSGASRRLHRVSAALLALPVLLTAGIAAAAPPHPTSSSAAAATSSAALAVPGGDADGDALLDDWEINGYDADGDGDIEVDLPAMGADPMHKDVFVEMDSMGAEETCPCHLPLKADLKRIVKVYATSPLAENPDGKRGIRMHLDAGPVRGAAYDLGGGNLVPHDADLNPAEAEFAAIKATNFDVNRAKIFHYMVWGHQYNGGTSSGLSFGIAADSFIVTLGGFPQHGTSNAKVGTFVHELGHNLGLRHGGNQNTNYKPNYLSVMTYAFQIDGVPRVGDPKGYFGYSKADLPDLAESTLAEPDGLGDNQAKQFRTKWFCPAGSLVTSPGRADKPLDWNCNGSIDGEVAVDLNDDDGLTTLSGFRDWGNLVFDGGTIGAGAAGNSAERPVELTAEEYLRTTG